MCCTVARPEVVTQPVSSLTVNEWSMVQLKCQYRGDPLPQVTWMRSDNGAIEGVINENKTEDMVTNMFIMCMSVGVYKVRKGSQLHVTLVVRLS